MHHRLVEIKKQIGKFIANFSVTAEDGKEYIFDGDIIREGLEISTYDENGDVIAREPFAIPEATGAKDGKELMKCFTQTSLHFYAHKNSSSDTEPRVLNVYELYVVEGDIFAK